MPLGPLDEPTSKDRPVTPETHPVPAPEPATEGEEETGEE